MTKPSWVRIIVGLLVIALLVIALLVIAALVLSDGDLAIGDLPLMVTLIFDLVDWSFINWTYVAVAIVAVASLWGIWWLWWRLPQRQVARLTLKIRDPKARADVEDNFRKTVGQALGGAAVLIAAGAAYLQFLQQQQGAHDLLISNQVAKGFEQLGNKELATRLGGIYGLEGVMNTSAQYHRPVLEALCAFVRDGTIGKTITGGPATDIQAALTVIGRREGLVWDGPGAVNLARAIIPNVDLTSAKLDGANLEGANLGGARLDSAHLGQANLTHAELSRASLARANLDYANLEDANLSNAFLALTDLDRTNLKSANLDGADLTKAHLTRDPHAFIGAEDQLAEACGKPHLLPPGLKLDRLCPPPVVPPLDHKATP